MRSLLSFLPVDSIIKGQGAVQPLDFLHAFAPQTVQRYLIDLVGGCHHILQDGKLHGDLEQHPARPVVALGNDTLERRGHYAGQISVLIL